MLPRGTLEDQVESGLRGEGREQPKHRLVKDGLQDVKFVLTLQQCGWYALHQATLGGLLAGTLLELAKPPPAGMRSVTCMTAEHMHKGIIQFSDREKLPMQIHRTSPPPPSPSPVVQPMINLYKHRVH